MKKILIITAMAFTVVNMFAQDDEKGVRFGLNIDPSINWYKPDGKIMAKNGVGVKFGGGLSAEIRLAKVASLVTGLNIDLDGGKIKYNNDGFISPNGNTVVYWYDNANDKIAEYSTYNGKATGPGTGFTPYQLNERIYKATYITIPIGLKLKTKEIGMMTYFGQIGVNNSLRWKAKADDKLINLSTGGTDSKSGTDITKDMSFYNAALTFGAGAEMNLSGSTSLTFSIHYNLGFTNVVKSESVYEEKITNSSTGPFGAPTYSPMPQVLKTNAVVLNIGVLF